MKRRHNISLLLAIIFLAAFIVWTAAVQIVDVQYIGPRSSHVGFATINSMIHEYVGVHMLLYTVTDWLGLVPMVFTIGFAILGLIQWIRRKKIRMVDPDILVLGGFYIIVAAVYMLFEIYAVNFRPVLINGYLEASYPSSTTMLVTCVMPTAAMQFKRRMNNKTLRCLIVCVISIFTVFMVIGRFISGVHWFSDIIGGLLFSAGMVLMYHHLAYFKTNHDHRLSRWYD